MKPIVFAGLCLLAGAATARDASAPVTEMHDVQDRYYDVKVTDPYRWLEVADDPEVKAWSRAQDARTRGYLDGLPQRAPMFRGLMDQYAATSSSFSGLQAVGGLVFAYYEQPPKEQPMIALLPASLDPKGMKVVLDPNVLNPKGTTAIDWFVPSPDGRRVAVSLSENGSEDGTLHVFDVESGKETGDTITRVQYPTGGGSVAWWPDSKGFWYTRYPAPDRPADEQHFFMKVYRHALGSDPEKDAYVMGNGLPKVAEISLRGREDSDTVIITVANGDGGEFAHYLLTPDDKVRQVTRFEDKVVFVTQGADGNLYLVSHQGAPHGKLLRLARAQPDLAKASVVVPASDAVIQAGGEFGGAPVVVTRNAVYVRELVGGPSRVAVFGLDGKARGELPLANIAAVDEVEVLGDGSLVYSVAEFLRPPYFARYVPATGKSTETALVRTSPVHFDDTEVVREVATSRDGTQVPMFIVRRKGTKLDGHNPVLLYGYGGYAINTTPFFIGPNRRLWLDGGGVYVLTVLRGGGEFGEEWHLQGNLTHKQNVFDDFAACARHLVEAGYTQPDRLAILGGSNGGLLMGAMITQHPDLFRAVVSEVGIYDMLRVEQDPNGAFNTTEFGSVKVPEQFRALYAYSPYHHVVDGTRYPAILMQTGETDGRVNPAHSRKMVARLQAATASGRPVYLSTNEHAGHGIGSSLSIQVGQISDVYAFLFDQLGMSFPPQ